jgi:hypothetical protein
LPTIWDAIRLCGTRPGKIAPMELIAASSYICSRV